MDWNVEIAALDAMGEAKAALARAADCPPWRHAAFGAVMGAIILSLGVPTPYNFAVQAVGLLGIAAIVVSDRRRMGVFVNGYRKGATRPITVLMLALMLVNGWAEAMEKEQGLSWETRAALPLFGAILATMMSVQWQRIFRRELGVEG